MKILFAAIFFALLSSTCAKTPVGQHSALPEYKSFREIPGITDDEIKAIEAILGQRDFFVYGTTQNTEAFYNDDGEIAGFTALFCDWLTEIFGIPFNPAFHTWGSLNAGLLSREIDFTGELTPTEERLKTWLMTDAIAERPIKHFRIAGSAPLAEIAEARRLRYVFLEGTTTADAVTRSLVPGTYEALFVDNNDHAYELLKSGTADTFINEGPGEASFDVYGDVVARDFFPLIYEPVALSTWNPDLAPIISAVQKMLHSGGLRYLTELYNRGYYDYTKHKLFLRLTDDEQQYIKNNPVIPLAAEAGNYPVSFYNAREKQWQGIAFDALHEAAALTGLRFERINNEHDDWASLLQMLEDGKAYMITELMQYEARAGKFLWADTALVIDSPALISKSDFRSIHLNEIIYLKIGLIKGYGHTALFHSWFPNHSNATEYESTIAAFDALDRGEVDLVMTSNHELLIMTNYLERAGYKANFVFEYPFKSTFGFNKDHGTLLAIIDKALSLIDTKGISDQWMRKTYDYRAKVAQAQLPWFVGAASLFLCVLALLFVLFRRTRHAEKRLEKLVQERTTIMQQTLVKLETASKAKSQFLANMSHEIRTPMNAILGIAEIQLQRGKFELETEEALTKIYNSGNLLLGIINDILDLSKIEAGKLELSPCQYEVASAINDTVMLNMMRIGSKHIEFKLSVDENIPVQLIGDELRIKQILNNLLSNAFKYTEKGEVTLSISVEKEKAQPENVMLMFRVSDTGQGMTKEQIEKLFDEYARFNTEANRTTEGTGLGMSITRNLIQMMDGDIAVKSEAGRGSVFTVRLPQGRAGSGVLGKELAEGLTKFERNAAKQMRKSQIVFEPMPYGSILLVDDVESNLYVAKGLMAPYEMSIDTVMSGFEAIEKIKEGKVYDIVFMDHMMPKMDGIEAAQRIRALGYAPPIVALTANAIVGQADVFLANGFDGFISKPIDVRQLNAVLKKFVRDKQPPEVIEAALKERVGKTYNANSGAPPTLSPELAEIFVRDATKAIDVLEGIQGKGGIYEEYDLRLYTINTHAMKSALANISENDLSAVAAKLEQAGRAKDVALMANETQAFLDKLRKTIEKLAPQKKDASLSETATEDLTLLREKLLAIKEVCDEYDRKAAKDAIAELRQKKWLAATGKMLETMSEHLLNGDFEEVASVADKLLNRIGPA